MEWKCNSTDTGSLESGTDRNQICWISFSGDPGGTYTSAQTMATFSFRKESDEPSEIIAQMRLYLPVKNK